jgi:hypothetical protein
MTAASDYPAGKVDMSSIDIQTGTANPNVAWTLVDAVTDVGQHIDLFDTSYSGHGEVDIWFGPPPYWEIGPGTVAAGASQPWWFASGGNGDVGPQLIQAEPTTSSGELATTQLDHIRQHGPRQVSEVLQLGPPPVLTKPSCAQ